MDTTAVVVPCSDTPLGCPGDGNLNRLASLWDIVRKFDAWLSVAVFAHMGELIQSAKEMEDKRPGSAVPPKVLDGAIAMLLAMLVNAAITELPESIRSAQKMAKSFDESRSNTRDHVKYSELGWRLQELKDLMESEMRKQLFLWVPPSKASYFDNEKPMGQQVYDAFPSARLDLTEAGSCLACNRNNAAMMHLMLATEIGLRELGRDRQIPFALSGAIEFKQWGHILDELEKAVEKIQQWPNSHMKDEAQRFYNALLFDLRSFNDGYRKHLAHAREHTFTDSDALALWDHVSRFYTKLSTKVAEGQYTNLVWI